ncbi:MAG: hypothetical protein LBG82_02600 [Clostridiales Family XIII bacterium]|jgi:hypothetical protein|nr:hypothetical protein [Clostridiales Family XIII bacterium]
MKDIEYLGDFDEYMQRHEGISPEQAKLMKDSYEELNDELYRFVMNAIVG